MKIDSNNTCIWCGCKTKNIKTLKNGLKINICKKHENKTDEQIIDVIGKL